MQNPIKLWCVASVHTGRVDFVLGWIFWAFVMVCPAILIALNVLYNIVVCAWLASGLVALVGIVNLQIRRLRHIGLPVWLIATPVIIGLAGMSGLLVMDAVTGIMGVAYSSALVLWPGRRSICE